MSVLLVPPLEQPRSPEFPLGVLTFTVAVPGAEITAVVTVTCNCWLLVARVLIVVPLMTTTEAETNWLPFTIRGRPFCTSANVAVLGESDPMMGDGRALPQRGLSALQPWNSSTANTSAPGNRKKALIRFIEHRTPGLSCGPRFVGLRHGSDGSELEGNTFETRPARTPVAGEMFQSGYNRGKIPISRLQYPCETKHLRG